MEYTKLIQTIEVKWLIDVLSGRKPPFTDALDIEELVETSIKHGLSSVLYQAIIDEDIECSSELRLELKKAYFANFIRNTNISNVWQELKGLLNEQSYAFIPLKGIYLSQYIYSDMALRAMSDIDVLMKPDDAEEIYKILLAKGAVSSEPDYVRQETTTDHHLPGLTYQNVYIELHRGVLPQDATYNIPVHLIWDKASKVNDVQSVSAHINLVYLCLHLYYTVKRGGIRLSWLYDFIIYSQSDYFKQEKSDFMNVLKELNCQEPVLALLYVTEKLFDHHFSFIDHTMNTKGIRSIESRVLYFINNESEGNTSYGYEVALERLKNTKGLSNKLEFIISRIVKKENTNQSIFNRIATLTYRMLGMIKQKIISLFRF